MGFRERDSAMAIPTISNPNSDQTDLRCFVNGLASPPSVSLDVRLFFLRIAPCIVDGVPDRLTLHHIGHEIGVSLEINGSRIPASETASLTLRRDRLDKETSEVTYVSTDSVRVSCSIDFEVYEKNGMILCGSLERIESTWGNGGIGLENDSRSGWSMDCFMAASVTAGSSSFFQPMRGISSPSIEVYIAGSCSGAPVILAKTILVSPRRKASRQNTLDVIPEDEEFGKDHKPCNGLVRRPNLQIREAEVEDLDLGRKVYSEEMYVGEDGQLSWFNAGVRVGVGIGLGMCLGIGIGVGLLLHSYQTTTRNFRRRFL